MSKKNRNKPVAEVKSVILNDNQATETPENQAFTLQRKPIILGVLGVAILIAFSPDFNNGFLAEGSFNWDDGYYVVSNELIKNPTIGGFFKLFKSEVALNYHPLTMVSLWFNSLLLGNSAFSFKIVNILIHFFNSYLIFLFSWHLLNRRPIKNYSHELIAGLVALIWAVHPMHVESVSWISERKDVLYTLFFMLSCLQYVRFKETNQQKYFTYTLIFFVLSCLSKAMAVVLPLVLLLIDFWYENSFSATFNPKNILKKGAFFIISILIGLLAIHVQGGGDLGGMIQKTTTATAIDTKFSFVQKILFGFYGLLMYLIKFFVPLNLRNFYAYPPIADYQNIQYLLAPIIGIGLLSAIYLFRNRKKELFFGGIFFFVTLVLVLQFIAVGGAIFAERYSYLPYFGLAFGAIYWAAQKINQKTLLMAGGLVSLVFVFLTFNYVKLYENGGSLFAHTLAQEPKSIIAYENYLAYLNEKKDNKQIIKFGEQALLNQAVSDRILHNLAIAYQGEKNYEKAQGFYENALQNAKGISKSYIYANRGGLFQELKNYKNAVDDFSKAIELNPSLTPNIILAKAVAEEQIQQFDQALKDYTTAIETDASAEIAWANRGNLKQRMGDTKGAIADFNEALKLNPNSAIAQSGLLRAGAIKPEAIVATTATNASTQKDPETLYLLANSLYKENKVAESKKLLEEALKLNPTHGNSLGLLGIMADDAKQYAKAIGYYKKAIEGNPNSERIHYNLGNTYLHSGNVEEAIKYYAEAIRLNPSYERAYVNIIACYESKKDNEKATFYKQKLEGLKK